MIWWCAPRGRFSSAQGSPLGAEISVHKRIPMGGGLGGGSSDAATTLVALNQMWRIGLDFGSNWRQLAAALGADVPVFVAGQVGLGGGNRRTTDAGLPGGGFLVPGHLSGSGGADRIGIPGS